MARLICPNCKISFKAQYQTLFADKETGQQYYVCPNQKQKCRTRIPAEPEKEGKSNV